MVKCDYVDTQSLYSDKVKSVLSSPIFTHYKTSYAASCTIKLVTIILLLLLLGSASSTVSTSSS